MTTQDESKLKTLYKVLQPGNVVTSAWLESLGISRDLQRHYLKSGWLQSIGRGAFKKPYDTVEWQGAINAIQNQNQIKIHVGGLSALTIQGYGHYFRLAKERLYLYSPIRTILPKWFKDYDWNAEIVHKQTSFLSADLALKEQQVNQTTIIVSTPERAIMECLLLAPDKIDLVECYHVMEGLVNLKPKLVNELMVNCSSIQVKRLFLYMADKAKHQWFSFLKTDDFDLGNGTRMIAPKGVYISKYLISIPKELAEL